MFLATAFMARAQETKEVGSKFLGAESCSSSSCHGGASATRNQNLVWSQRDFHSRAFATLTTARSSRIAEALKIAEPAQSASCTVCHAPFHEVPLAKRAAALNATVGVSCETCHGAAEPWLRGHTRADWTHADRVAAGMRDLRDLYVRANACVACHQNLDTELLKAGHPELIFELDGQAVAQPKHWRERPGWSGAQTWLVGQAVALREVSWQLSRQSAPDEKLAARQSALLWLLQKSGELDARADGEKQAQNAADALARRASQQKWTDDRSREILARLAATPAEFRDAAVPKMIHARRAERLILALDRLAAADKDFSAETELNQLFKLTQSLPDFSPEQFAAALEKFTGKLRP